jgi:hypothetical protein
VDDGYLPFESSGYLPCTLEGEDSGFNIRFQDVDEAALPEKVKAEIGDRNIAIAFKWGGDKREFVSVMAVCAALAKNFGAIVHVPDDDLLYSTEDLLAKAKKAADTLFD